MLQQLDGSDDGSPLADVFDFKLPVIDRSIGDLVDLSGDFLDFVDELAANPAGALQPLEAKLRALLNLPQVGDPLGLGFGAPVSLNSPFSFPTAAAANGRLATDLSFKIFQGLNKVLVVLPASDTAANANSTQLKTQLQAAIDTALAKLGLAAGTITVGGAGNTIQLTSSVTGLTLNPFSVLSLDFDSKTLFFDLGFSSSVQLTRPFNLDLADANLGHLQPDRGLERQSGNLGVQAGIDMNLKLGLDLGRRGQGVLHRHRRDRTARQRQRDFGNDLSFEASLGPIGIFVEGGSASLAGTFDVDLLDVGRPG